MEFKKINIKEKVFHHIEINPNTHVLYDSQFDIPIEYGNRLSIYKIVEKLKEATICHYRIIGDKVTLKSKRGPTIK